MKKVIQKIIEGYDLSQKEAADVMNIIMKGEATDAQIAAFLTALRLKGEVITEIVGMAKVMHKYAVKIKPKVKDFVDCVGTGGDLMNTFNISTLASFVVAGAGVTVAKHGNRSVSSKCGSADLLEKLGVKIDLSAVQVQKCIEKVGIGFMFAPNFHPAMKHVANARREIGIRTIFNILGPLTNPAGAKGMVLGVYDEKLTSLLANVLRLIGVKRAFVVHGSEGLDEISLNGETRISELRHGTINTYTINPEDFGMEPASLNVFIGGSAEENAKMAKVILSGKENSPRTDIVLLNAAAAIAASSKATTLHEGLVLAHDSLFSGKANCKLKELIEFTKKMTKKGNKKIKVKTPTKKKVVAKKTKTKNKTVKKKSAKKSTKIKKKTNSKKKK